MVDQYVEINNFKDSDWALASFERRWSQEIQRVSLITELDVPQPDIDALYAAVRWLNRHRHDDLLKSLHRIPASVAVLVTDSVIRCYEGGTFWSNFLAAIDGHGTNFEREFWGEAFLAALRRFGLPRFNSDGSKKYLTPMLAHAGLPNYCLPDYFRALDKSVRQVGADPQAVSSWAAARVDTSLVDIDVPVRRFLSRGDEYATDFIDRTIDVLARLSRDADPATALLPDRVVDAARLYLEQSHRSAPADGRTRFGSVERLARVTLDPVEGELLLTLPPIEAVDDDVVWLVTAEGHTDEVATVKQMGGRTIGIRETTYPVRRAAKTISIAARGVERSQEIDLVDPGEPLVLFTEAGELIPAHVPLPSSKVWALYALGVEQAPEFSSLIVHETAPPLGWAGWRLSLVDLTGTHALRLSQSNRTRSVRHDARATLDTIETLPYVRSAGAPVHTKRPVLHLPDGVTAVWSLTVTNQDTGEVVVDREVRSTSTAHDTTDPFQGMQAPVVGRFAVALRGPLGKGLSTSLAIAEGLTVETSTRLRTFVSGGLTPCTVSLSGPDLKVPRGVLSFAPAQTEKSIEVESGEGRLEVLVTPPAMAVAFALDGVPDRWLHSPANTPTEDVDRTRLYLRLPLEAEPELRVLADSGELLQVIHPTVKSSNGGTSHLSVFELREASEVIARAGSCTLVVGEAPSIRLARISPRTLAQGALAVSGGIQLVDFAGGSVSARLWSLWEPWNQAQDVDVETGGFIALPDSLDGCGPVAVHLQVMDPWVPKSPPVHPDRYQSLFVDQSPSAESVESTLALAGRISQPAPLSLEKAWSLLAMRMRAPRGLFPSGAVGSLTAGLRQRPTDAMEALAMRGEGAKEEVQLLTSSGLLWTEVESAEHLASADDSRIARLVTTSPFIGALIASRRLAHENSPATLPATWAAARSVLGEAFVRIIEGQPDPAAGIGRLDNTRVYDQWSHDVFAHQVAAFGIVPQGMVHDDARFAAALGLFAERKRPGLGDLSRVSRLLTQRICNELALNGVEPLVKAVEARVADPRRELPIAHVSSVSLALAITARLASRRLPGASELVSEVRDLIDDLARYAPQLFAIDVVLAEAQICALLTEEHPRLTHMEDHI